MVPDSNSSHRRNGNHSNNSCNICYTLCGNNVVCKLSVHNGTCETGTRSMLSKVKLAGISVQGFVESFFQIVSFTDTFYIHILYNKVY